MIPKVQYYIVLSFLTICSYFKTLLQKVELLQHYKNIISVMIAVPLGLFWWLIKPLGRKWEYNLRSIQVRCNRKSSHSNHPWKLILIWLLSHNDSFLCLGITFALHWDCILTINELSESFQAEQVTLSLSLSVVCDTIFYSSICCRTDCCLSFGQQIVNWNKSDEHILHFSWWRRNAINCSICI